MKSFGLFLIVFAISLQSPGDISLPVTQAANRGDVELLQYYLTNGYDPNERDPNSNCTPLHTAKSNTIDLLIASGADINAKCKSGATPIHYPYGVSVSAGGSIDSSKVIKLIKAGADINAQDSVGKTVIHNAVIAGASEIVNLLLQKGADLTVQAYGTTTPLEYACIWNRINTNNIVGTLVKAGASIVQAADVCWGALYDSRTPPDFAKTLEEVGFSIDHKFQKSGLTLLQNAFYADNAKVAKMLFSMGAPTEGVGPLYLAVLKNSVADVRRLIDSGVTPDDRPNLKYPTSLFLAADLGYEDIVIELLKRGASLHPVSPYYQISLVVHLARSGSLAVLEYLEKNMPEMFSSKEVQSDLISVAASSQNAELLNWSLTKIKVPMPLDMNELDMNTVQLLCRAGFQVYPQTLKQALEDYRPGRIEVYVRECGGAYNDASYQDSFEQSLGKISLEDAKVVLKTLPSNAKVLNKHFLRAFSAHRLDLADYFLGLGADVNYKQTSSLFGEAGNTPLFQADTDQEIQFLIDRGADLNVVNAKGLSPIWYANTKEEVQAFMKHGLNVNHLNKSGETILFRWFNLATDSGFIISFGNSRFYRDLIALGVDVTIKNAEGLTVLEKYLKETQNPDPLVVRDLKAAEATVIRKKLG